MYRERETFLNASECNFSASINFLKAILDPSMRTSVGVLFSFDGASRGNPGKSALGQCAWWGIWSSTEFHPKEMLMQHGINIGLGTNNLAESWALAYTVQQALSWFFGICNELAAYTRIHDFSRHTLSD